MPNKIECLGLGNSSYNQMVDLPDCKPVHTSYTQERRIFYSFITQIPQTVLIKY